jgi:hypothetical protein
VTIANKKKNGHGSISKRVMEKQTSLTQIMLFSAEISVLKMVGYKTKNKNYYKLI